MNQFADFYLKQQPKLLRNHQKMMVIGRRIMEKHYGGELAGTAVAEATVEYEQLIPQIPYIGGLANSMTDTLVQMTSLLALYRVLHRRGKPVDEIGDLFFEMAQARVSSFPKFLRRLIGKVYLSHWNQRRLKKRAAVSQQRRYPGDFVFELVPRDEKQATWGINYLECAVVKFFAEQGAAELTPQMCRIDYLLFPAMGIELKRTGTIAQGCSHCDFRFQANR